MDKVHKDHPGGASGEQSREKNGTGHGNTEDKQQGQDNELVVELDKHREDHSPNADYEDEEQLQIAVYRIPDSHKVRIVKVVPLPHARSEIWSYFGFIADDSGEIQDRKKVICKVCATTLSYSGNTTNLFTHLKSMHPEANPQKMPPTNKTPWRGKRIRKRIMLDSSNPDDGDGSHVAVTGDSLTEDDGRNETSPSDPQPRPTVLHNRIRIINVRANSLDAPTILPSNCSPEEITNAIVDVIVKDFRPVSLVEGKGFQALINLLAPNYQMPEVEQFSRLAKRRFEQMKKDCLRNGENLL